jgi:hypothetical protein
MLLNFIQFWIAWLSAPGVIQSQALAKFTSSYCSAFIRLRCKGGWVFCFGLILNAAWRSQAHFLGPSLLTQGLKLPLAQFSEPWDTLTKFKDERKMGRSANTQLPTIIKVCSSSRNNVNKDLISLRTGYYP